MSVNQKIRYIWIKTKLCINHKNIKQFIIKNESFCLDSRINETDIIIVISTILSVVIDTNSYTAN